MTAVATATVTCARCSNVTTDPVRDHWLVRREPIVVQGITLGLCLACMGGNTPAEGDERHCDRSCKGAYRPVLGAYFEAVRGRWPNEEKWACWDRECVEGWVDDQDPECSECGQDIDIDVTEYS
ncbi:MAG TPA: hypothetical protein VFE45_14840, partial [Coriobacteriia bacterium]|nr:hypothetical protein [Coriobacteriia bacterium]